MLCITNGINIDDSLLKEKLDGDKLIILAGQVNGYLHAILLCGYEEDNFIVCDPLYKNKQTRTCKEINEFINTLIGKWFVAVDK